jgi:hypothetical protein
MKTVALSLLLSSGCTAFAPASFGQSRSHSALHVSAVRDLIFKEACSTSKPLDDGFEQLLEAFQTQTPESVGIKGAGIQTSTPVEELTTRTRRRTNQKRRKHNFRQQAHLQEDPDLDFFTLHSSAVSNLYKDIPVNDIV